MDLERPETDISEIMDEGANLGREHVRTVRDLGFEAASEVVERFIGSLRPQPPPPEEGSSPGVQRDAFRQLRADLARAVDANLDLIRRAFDLYAGAVDRLLGTEPESVAGAPESHVKMPPVLPGHRASTTLWIHNTTSQGSPALRLHASDLFSPAGEIISAGRFEFEPVEIDIAPPGSSIPVAVELAIGSSVPPGIYRGYVFVTNLPTEYLTIEVEVVGGVGVPREEPWPVRRQAS
jgi:hypothetical protein